MMMCVLLIVDIYVLCCVCDLFVEVWMVVEEVDVVIYVGDWVDEWLFDECEVRVCWFVVVWGNNDYGGLC